MKQIKLLLLMLFVSMAVSPQEINVISFTPAQNDVTANMDGTIVYDQNGDKCALIKIETTQTGFTFDVGVLGVVKTEYHPGEIWLYVPHGVKNISISHQTLGMLRDYDLGMSVQEARTYIMKLSTGKIVGGYIEKDFGGNYLILTVEPKDAEVLVDGNMLKVDAEGVASAWLKYGVHQYEIFASMHKRTSGTVTITNESSTEKTITLQPNYSIVTITAPNQADIYVNNEKKGTGRWNGKLGAGEYMLEARKTSHRSTKTTIKVGEWETISKTLEAPIPQYGIINIQTSPAKATLLIDGKEMGITPGIYKNILIGERELTLKKEGYETIVKTVIIEEGEVRELNITMSAIEKVESQMTVDLEEEAPFQEQLRPKASGTHNGHEYVDLGLSVMWATCNVGANKPQNDGYCYQWGMTEPGKYFASSTLYNKNVGNISGKKEYDAARSEWGGVWRIPTQAEFKELKEKCSWQWVTISGVNGYKITGQNGNSIFLPATGYKHNMIEYLDNKQGNYWASLPLNNGHQAYKLMFNSTIVSYNHYDSYENGCYVRAVCDTISPISVTTTNAVQTTTADYSLSSTAKSTPASGKHNGHEYVDLGLSVKWATCNVGAENPYDYGEYYAWGEASHKFSYTSTTYKFIFNSNPKTLPMSRDAARINWGGKWRMPTHTEFEELLNNCTYQKEHRNGVVGYTLKSKINGNTIFLPLSGFYQSTNLNSRGKYGGYWSSTLHLKENAHYLYLEENRITSALNHRRIDGLSIRPVCE